MDRRLRVPIAIVVALGGAIVVRVTMGSTPTAEVRSGVTSPSAVVAPAPTEHPADRRTVVVIMTDDQRADLLPWMPSVQKHLVDEGTLFESAFVVNPACCPSRAAFLTGTYSHTNGVWANLGAQGGHAAFRANGNEARTFATWLDRDGWRTALIGKYMNGYGTAGGHVPAGWDRWLAFSMANGDFYGYRTNEDGRLRWHGASPRDYSTDVFTRAAVRTIRATAPNRKLLLVVGYYAPHGPRTPAERHRSVEVDPRPVPQSFDERRLADKPPYVRAHRGVSREVVRARHVAQVRSLMAVDDGVRRIVHALDERDRLGGALVVFTSDNGWLDGEHGISGKFVPYEEAIRVPLVIRADAFAAAPDSTGLIALNIDLAPTIARFAGVRAADVDGTSLLPLLEGDRGRWRRRFLFEHLRVRAIPNDPPTYCGVRSRRWKFVRYEDGFEELYDLRSDPWELRNVAGRHRYGAETSRARDALRRLCRPRPPGMSRF